MSEPRDGNRRNNSNPTQNMKVYGRRRAWPMLLGLAVLIPLTAATIALAPNPSNLLPDQEQVSTEHASEPAAETTTQEPEASGQENEQAASQESGDDASEREDGQATSNQTTSNNAGQPQEQPEEQETTPPSSNEMGLTVPKLGIYGDTVRNSADPEVLHQGAQKLPPTGFPWQEGANTYIAGHRIGFPGTESHNQFYNLPAMQEGDAVSLTDANGTEYDYEVTEIFAVGPSESWVTEPVAGKDMVTLQTCTHSVDDWWSITPQLFEAGPETGRLVVRAERV